MWNCHPINGIEVLWLIIAKWVYYPVPSIIHKSQCTPLRVYEVQFTLIGNKLSWKFPLPVSDDWFVVAVNDYCTLARLECVTQTRKLNKSSFTPYFKLDQSPSWWIDDLCWRKTLKGKSNSIKLEIHVQGFQYQIPVLISIPNSSISTRSPPSMIVGAKVWPLSWIQAIEHAIGPLILSLENNLSFAGAIVS